MNEADTCRIYVVPKLQAAGWDAAPHRINEQATFTAPAAQTPGQRVVLPLIRSHAPATLTVDTVAAVLAEMEETEVAEVADNASVVRR